MISAPYGGHGPPRGERCRLGLASNSLIAGPSTTASVLGCKSTPTCRGTVPGESSPLACRQHPSVSSTAFVRVLGKREQDPGEPFLLQGWPLGSRSPHDRTYPRLVTSSPHSVILGARGCVWIVGDPVQSITRALGCNEVLLCARQESRSCS